MKDFIERLLKKLLCCHEWVLVEKVGVYATEDDTTPIYYKLIYMCKKCGKFKKIRI